MFVTFLALLIGGSMLPIIVFSSGELVGLVGLEIPSRPAEKSSLRRGIGYGRTFTQAYIWFGWAAYCAWLAIRFGVEPDIAYPRVYHLIALLATGLPVAYLAVVSRKYVSSDEERGQLQRGTRLWRVLLFFGFCVFFVPPGLMGVPYGWLNHAQQAAVGHAMAGMSTTLRAPDGLLIPSSDHPPSVADGAEPVRVPEQSALLTPRWWANRRSGPESPVARCEREGDEPLSEDGSEADDPCADEVEQE